MIFRGIVDFVVNRQALRANPFPNYKDIMVHAHPNANNGRAFDMHVLLIYDVEMNETLKKMPSSVYFKQEENMARENPQAIVIYVQDIIPGKSYPSFKFPIDNSKNLVNCIILCDLVRSKDRVPRKVIVGNLEKFSLTINESGVSLHTNS